MAELWKPIDLDTYDEDVEVEVLDRSSGRSVLDLIAESESLFGSPKAPKKGFHRNINGHFAGGSLSPREQRLAQMKPEDPSWFAPTTEHPERYRLGRKMNRDAEIRSRVKDGIPLTQIAEELGVSRQRVHQIAND